MNILGIFLNNELRSGGHKRYLELMEGLAARGNGVTVFMNTELDWKPAHFTDLRIPVSYVVHRTPFVGRLFRNRIAAATRRSGMPAADWIVIFGETHWDAARYLSAGTGCPILFAFRSDSIEENRLYLRLDKPSRRRRLVLHLMIAKDRIRERQIARKAECIVFQSGFDRDNFVRRNGFAAGKATVIRGDIRQPRFRPECANRNSSDACSRLLFVGSLGNRKGIEYLLRALALLAGKGIDGFHLDIIAGKNGMEKLLPILEGAGLSGIVTFRGKTDDPLPWMIGSDLVIVPSVFDSYPNVVLEALHVGVPVIGSRTGGIPDMLRDDLLLFEPCSPESLAERLEPLIADQNAYRTVRALCADRRAYFDFDWPEQWELAMASFPKNTSE